MVMKWYFLPSCVSDNTSFSFFPLVHLSILHVLETQLYVICDLCSLVKWLL